MEDDKVEKAKREKAEQQKKEREAKEKEARKLAQQRAAARQAQLMAAAPNAGVESQGTRAGEASWRREVEAQVRRNAAYPADGGGATGTARITVTIGRNGRLLSHRLAGSSGSPALDRAAMAIIERAQPFPPFPAGMTQAQITDTLPMHLRPR
jgi:protein TonB